MADEALTTEPHDRLTRLAALARDAVTASPEWNEETDKLFVSLDDGTDAAFYDHGHEGPRDLVVTLLMHIRAISKLMPRMN